jgi:hypothetical protein
VRCASNVHSQDTAGPQEKDIGGATRWPCGTTHRSVQRHGGRPHRECTVGQPSPLAFCPSGILQNLAQSSVVDLLGCQRGDSTEGWSQLSIDRCRTILNLAITVHPCSRVLSFPECERSFACWRSLPAEPRHVHWRTGYSDPWQHDVARTAGVTLFDGPNLSGDSKTT